MTNPTIAGATPNPLASQHLDGNLGKGAKEMDLPVGWFPEKFDNGILSGTPSQMLAALINSGVDASTVLLATQIVEASQLTRNLLQNVNQLRELKAGIQQRVTDLEALSSWLKQNTLGGGNGKEKAIDPSKLNYADFFDKNPGLGARLGVTKASIEATVKKYAAACAKTPNDPPTFEKACPKEYADLSKRVQQLLVSQTFSLDKGQVKISLGDPINLDPTALKAAVDRQNQDQGAIDTQISLINLRLQQAMQERERLVTLSTNCTAAAGRGQMAITKNIQ